MPCSQNIFRQNWLQLMHHAGCTVDMLSRSFVSGLFCRFWEKADCRFGFAGVSDKGPVMNTFCVLEGIGVILISD